MSAALVYCDASALVKLFVEEEESGPLRTLLRGEVRLASSEIVRVEVFRALARRGDHRDDERAAAHLEALSLIRLDAAVLARAASLPPPSLRTLDALHLATALSLSPPPRYLLCYDRNLAEAARRHGLDVVAPGADEASETP